MLTPLLFAAASVVAVWEAPAPGQKWPQPPPRSDKPPALVVSADVQDARGPEWFREKEEFERRQLQDSGLPSLAELAADGREVVQIVLESGYGPSAAIQVEKVGASATLTLFNPQGPIVTIPLEPDEWRTIYDADLNAGLASLPDGDDNPYIDHSPIARVGWAGGGESLTHSAVGSDPGMVVADFAARTALQNSADCMMDYRPRQIFRTVIMLQQCFTPQH